jgi:hypothetical protein
MPRIKPAGAMAALPATFRLSNRRGEAGELDHVLRRASRSERTLEANMIVGDGSDLHRGKSRLGRGSDATGVPPRIAEHPRSQVEGSLGRGALLSHRNTHQPSMARFHMRRLRNVKAAITNEPPQAAVHICSAASLRPCLQSSQRPVA